MLEVFKSLKLIYNLRVRHFIFYSMLFLIGGFLELLGISALVLIAQRLLPHSGSSEESIVNSFLNLDVEYVSIIVIAVIILKSAAYLLIQRSIFSFGRDCQAELMQKIFDNALNSRLASVIEPPSKLVQNVSANSNIVTNKALVPILKIVAELFVMVALVILVVFTYPVMFLFLACTSLITNFIVFRPIRYWQLKLGTQFTESNTKVIAEVDQASRNWKEIAVLGAMSFFKDKLRTYSNQFCDVNAKFSFYNIIPRPLLEVSIVISIILYLVYSSIIGTTDEEILKSLIIAGGVGLRLLPGLSNITVLAGQVKFARVAVLATRDILDSYAVRLNDENNRFFKKSLINKSKNIFIVFENVTLVKSGYVVFRNMNLKFSLSSSSSLSGPTGAGKTSFINILLGFEEITDGSVYLSVNSIKYSVNNVQSIAAYVPQRPEVFDVSLRENLTLGKEFSDKTLEEVLNQVGLWSFVNMLPNSLETMLGQSGANLSGGQRQKLGLARALLHRKEILILDEPTASLDSTSEDDIINLLSDVGRDHGLIIVTHDEGPKKICDRHYLVENNSVKEVSEYAS